MWWLSNKTLRLKTRLIYIHIISRIHRMLALAVASTTLQSQLPMAFTLPLTRLAFKDLRPHATLTTWVSTLYVRLTDSLECQMRSLPWILTKLYKWGTTMKLPLIRVMELRPDQMRHHHEPHLEIHGITLWPMRHHHETIVELRPNQTNIMFPSINLESFLMPKPCHFDNQPSHTGHMPRSY